MNLVVSWYNRDVKKQRFQVRYWVVSNIFIFLYISRETFVEKFSKCCENGIACLRKGKLHTGGHATNAAMTSQFFLVFSSLLSGLIFIDKGIPVTRLLN